MPNLGGLANRLEDHPPASETYKEVANPARLSDSQPRIGKGAAESHAGEKREGTSEKTSTGTVLHGTTADKSSSTVSAGSQGKATGENHLTIPIEKPKPAARQANNKQQAKPKPQPKVWVVKAQPTVPPLDNSVAVTTGVTTQTTVSSVPPVAAPAAVAPPANTSSPPPSTPTHWGGKGGGGGKGKGNRSNNRAKEKSRSLKDSLQQKQGEVDALKAQLTELASEFEAAKRSRDEIKLEIETQEVLEEQRVQQLRLFPEQTVFQEELNTAPPPVKPYWHHPRIVSRAKLHPEPYSSVSWREPEDIFIKEIPIANVPDWTCNSDRLSRWLFIFIFSQFWAGFIEWVIRGDYEFVPIFPAFRIVYWSLSTLVWLLSCAEGVSAFFNSFVIMVVLKLFACTLWAIMVYVANILVAWKVFVSIAWILQGYHSFREVTPANCRLPNWVVRLFSVSFIHFLLSRRLYLKRCIFMYKYVAKHEYSPVIPDLNETTPPAPTQCRYYKPVIEVRTLYGVQYFDELQYFGFKADLCLDNGHSRIQAVSGPMLPALLNQKTLVRYRSCAPQMAERVIRFAESSTRYLEDYNTFLATGISVLEGTVRLATALATKVPEMNPADF